MTNHTSSILHSHDRKQSLITGTDNMCHGKRLCNGAKEHNDIDQKRVEDPYRDLLRPMEESFRRLWVEFQKR